MFCSFVTFLTAILIFSPASFGVKSDTVDESNDSFDIFQRFFKILCLIGISFLGFFPIIITLVCCGFILFLMHIYRKE